LHKNKNYGIFLYRTILNKGFIKNH
jgi:hypothetical protein